MSPDATVTTKASTDTPTATPSAGAQRAPGPSFRLVRDPRVAFLIVGASNTVLGTAWFVTFELLLGARVGTYGYMVSLACAHVAAVLCAFVLHRRFVFRVRGQVWLDLLRFEMVNLGALGINLLALPLCVELFGLPPIPAQLLITSVTALVSYFGHKGFSFRRGTPAPPAPQRLHHEEGSTS